MNKIFGGKNKMAKFKKVAILVLAVLMLFGIFALSAGCSYGDKFEEFQQRIDKLEEEKNSFLGRVQDLEEGNYNL